MSENKNELNSLKFTTSINFRYLKCSTLKKSRKKNKIKIPFSFSFNHLILYKQDDRRIQYISDQANNNGYFREFKSFANIYFHVYGFFFFFGILFICIWMVSMFMQLSIAFFSFSFSFCYFFLCIYLFIYVICSCYIWLPLTSNGKMVVKQPNKIKRRKKLDRNI